MNATQVRLMRVREAYMDSEPHIQVMKSLPGNEEMLSLKTGYKLTTVQTLVLELFKSGLIRFDRWYSNQWQINEKQLASHFELTNMIQ